MSNQMRGELVETAKRYSETQDRLEEINDEINELRQQTFGDESEETEEKARQLFNEVSHTNDESSKTEQLNSLRDEKEELQEERAETETDLLELLVDIKFSLDETIQGDQPPVEFPFNESIDPAVLNAISAALSEDMQNGEVEIRTDMIVVDTASVNDAIESVERKVTQIRQRADANLDVPAHVKKVKDRDPKVAAMLYVLHENNNEPMTKAELEDAISLDRGDLRGQLYYVLDNDPYLKKQDDGNILTPNGMKVIERFVEQHSIPELITNDNDLKSDSDEKESDDDTEEQEEVMAYE